MTSSYKMRPALLPTSAGLPRDRRQEVPAMLIAIVVTLGICGAMLGALSGTEILLAPVASLQLVTTLAFLFSAIGICSATGGSFAALVLFATRHKRRLQWVSDRVGQSR